MQVKANGITLEVEDHGSPNGEPLVLIMGLGMQLIAWHEDFVQSLVDRGFRVIRFDNRDIGKSSRMTGGKRLTPFELLKLRFLSTSAAPRWAAWWGSNWRCIIRTV